jgi:hypothetical protein
MRLKRYAELNENAKPNNVIEQREETSKGGFKYTVITVGDKEACDDAKTMVGDGNKVLDKFFITTSNDYLFDTEEGVDYYTTDPDAAPVKLTKIYHTYLPVVTTWEKAKEIADGIDMGYNAKRPDDSIMNVTVEDRRCGTCYERNIFLKMKVSEEEHNLENGRYADKIYGAE